MKHSDGKWSVGAVVEVKSVVNGMQRRYLAVGNGAEHIGLVSAPSGYEKQTEANARLIVAAPDLLAALEALASTARTFRNVPKEDQDWGPLDDEALEAAFAAIAKATGGSGS